MDVSSSVWNGPSAAPGGRITADRSDDRDDLDPPRDGGGSLLSWSGQRHQPPLARQRAWLDRLLWALLLLSVVPLSVVFSALPWTNGLNPTFLGAVLLLGLIGGGLALFVARLGDAVARRRDPDSPLGIVGPLLLFPVLIGVAVTGGLALPVAAGNWDAGYVVCGALAAIVGAALPVLVFTRSAWLAIGLGALVVTAIWHAAALSPSQHVWLAVLFADWALLAGSAALRTQARSWARQRLAIHGAVWWPALRRTAAYTALVAVVALLPLLAVEVPPLQQLWDQSPFHHSPLISSAVNATPSVLLGQPLRLTSPATTGNQVLLTYALRRVPTGWPGPTALVGATLDTYANGVWSASATTLLSNAPLPSPAPDAATVDLEVTLATVPPSSTGAVRLPSVETPISFSVPSTTALLAPADGQGLGAAPPADWGTAQLSVEDWQAAGPIGAGYHYKVTAVLPDLSAAASVPAPLPSDPQAYGWSPAVYARLTAVPAALAPTLASDAQAWAGSGTTVLDEAQALADHLHQRWTLALTASEPPGDAAVSDVLATQRANGLTWVTAYALLCRSLGIPTRVALGYGPGLMDRATGQMTVRTSDFLAWVQVALPGVGWYSVYPIHSLTEEIVVPGPGANAAGGTGHPTSTPTPTASSATQTNGAGQTGGGKQPQQRGVGAGGHPPTSFLPLPLTTPLGWVVDAALLLLLIILILLLLIPLLIWWSHTRAGRRMVGAAVERALVLTLRQSFQLASSAGAPLRPSDTPGEALRHAIAALPASTNPTAQAGCAAALRRMSDAYVRLRFRDASEMVLTWAGLVAATATVWQALRPWGWAAVRREPWRGAPAWFWLWRHSRSSPVARAQVRGRPAPMPGASPLAGSQEEADAAAAPRRH